MHLLFTASIDHIYHGYHLLWARLGLWADGIDDHLKLLVHKQCPANYQAQSCGISQNCVLKFTNLRKKVSIFSSWMDFITRICISQFWEDYEENKSELWDKTFCGRNKLPYNPVQKLSGELKIWTGVIWHIRKKGCIKMTDGPV